MYKKVDTNLNFVEREKQTEKFWKENQIFEKSLVERDGARAVLTLSDLLGRLMPV